MALADRTIPSDTVQIPDGDGFAAETVWGLTPEHLVILLMGHRSAMETFYAKVAEGDLPTDDYMAMVVSMMAEAPALLGALLACGFNEPDQAEFCRKLPLSVQVDALDKIAALTFAAEGGAKKLAGTIIRVMQTMTQSLDDPKALPPGFGVFGGR
jgi:hypothetical protein